MHLKKYDNIEKYKIQSSSGKVLKKSNRKMTKTNEKKRRKNEKEAGSQSYLSADNKMEARQEAIEAQDGRRGIIEASRAEREA